MNMPTSTIAERKAMIKGIVTEILEIEAEEMTETSLFKEDHGADSLRAIEILASLEKAFSVQIAQESLAAMVNLDGVYGIVKTAANWNE
ncbi:acyl carrier protein [Janthinobacterium fluminis]|uniref:Acyl carrier protein n=1 Tax=Janthinobacterium fluminis TaxID=2987524 RepID=A0ABT5K1U2_9BURK|nr:acyl carrier protein [Janthinobacterium fluminis]MDC8758943.1 acyl carrier protein [Janthinobacterium fluminis]